MLLEECVSCRFIVIYLYVRCSLDRFYRLGKRELIFLLSFTCNYVISVMRGLLFSLVLGIGQCYFNVTLPGPSI